MYDLVLRGGTIWNADGALSGDVAVRDGQIAAIGALDGDAAEIVDVAGKLILPGGVDPHAHIEQISGMGVLNADTFETATASAAMGGTTSVISFAAQPKGGAMRAAVDDYAARARRGAMIDYAFHLSISDADAPEFHQDVPALMAEGHRTAKVFTTYNIQLTDKEILQVMGLARAAGGMVCVHAENDAIIALARQNLLDQGRTAPRDHATARPPMAEIEAIERMCRFAEHTGALVMIFHVSTAQGVACITEAKARGAPVLAETCPQYLLMTEEVLDKPGVEGAKWMCSPPQRSQADQEALWQGLRTGAIDLVSSDHAPYRFDETGKFSSGPNPPFPQIANGMPGLETRLPLLFDAIVSRGRGTVQDFVRYTSQAPASLYGLTTKGRLAPGYDADLVVWDADRGYTYSANDLHDNVGYNPWEGTTVRGWPEQVFLRGKQIATDGKLTARPGQGAWLNRPAHG